MNNEGRIRVMDDGNEKTFVDVWDGIEAKGRNVDGNDAWDVD